MKTAITEVLKQEAAKVHLRFTCPDCAYFEPKADSCSEGYPTAEHRHSGWERESLIFCKLFEIGS